MKKLTIISLALGLLMNTEAAVAQESVIQSTALKLPVGTFANMKRTTFDPTKHGFKFSNEFQTQIQIAGLNGPRFGGLCGGMVYSALDYYKTNEPIPAQTHRPASGTTLHQYILTRQNNSTLLNSNGGSNADKWAELILNPFGWRTNEFFNWGLQGSNGGRVQELVEMMRSGSPVPLGLFKDGNGGVGPHHQVLAIGYDLGRYKGDLGDYKEDFKIFIYDPNYPNQTMTLRVNPAAQNYYYQERPDNKWLTYFVDKKYTVARPPAISSTPLANDGLVRQLLIEIGTGGDDLRGGNDNVNVIVKYTDGSTDIYPTVNKRVRWMDNYKESVLLSLRRAAPLGQIKCVMLQTTFGGGIGGDNWNVDLLRIVAKSSDQERVVFAQTGSPLVRFDGNNRPFEAVLR